MKKSIFTLPLMVGLLNISFCGFAEETVNANVQSQKAISIETLKKRAREIVKEKIENYLSKQGLHQGWNEDRYIQYVVVGGLKITEPNFYRRKEMLYWKAYAEVLRKVAQVMQNKIAGELYYKFFSDKSSIPPEFINDKTSYWELIEQRLKALSVASLDNLLKKLGVDPSLLGDLTIEQKKKLMERVIYNKIKQKTFAELSGITILKTVEGDDKEGNYAVGLVILYSPKLKQLAYDIIHKQKPAIKRKGKPIYEYLPKSNEAWLSSWGVRVVIDDKGYPALISYGQWAEPLDDEEELEDLMEAAKEQAESEADNLIAQFMQAYYSFEKLSEKGFKKTKSLIKEINVSQAQKDIRKEIDKEIKDIVSTLTKVRTNVDLTGLYTLKEQNFIVKVGGRKYLVYIVARAWTYDSYLNARNMREWKPKPKIITSKKELKKSVNAKKEKGYKEQIFESPDTTDVYDW